MKYTSNDASGIGASCTLLSLDGKNILIDTGISFEKMDQGNIARGPSGGYFEGDHIDLIIITHSHNDHIGSLPRFAREHPEALIIITRQALNTGQIMLWDALSISEKLKLERPEIEQVFTESDMYKFSALDDSRIVIIEEDELPAIQEDPEFPNWVFGFHPIGHDPGAIMIFIAPPTGRPVIITGDASAHDQGIVKGVLVPDEKFLSAFLGGREAPILIAEATGGTKMPRVMPPEMSIVEAVNYSRELTMKELIQSVHDVKNRGGQCLFPTFAKGRSANVVLALIDAGFVPHLDGLACKLFMLEVSNAKELITKGKVILIEGGRLGFEHRKALWSGSDTCGHDFSPMIVPSATLDGGWSAEYARHFMGNAKNAVIFTGHIFTDSTSEKVINLEKGHTIKLRSFIDDRDVRVYVRCEVKHFDLSAHDSRPAIVERIRLLRPAHTIIQHCDEKSFRAVAGDVIDLNIDTRTHRGYGRREFEIN
jgi:Cft2 family RNA processing exonuclease